MTDDEHKECNAILDAVYAARTGARLIATDFHALPSRTLYPDYYDAIPEPVCLDEVEARLDGREFASAQAFVVDLQLVFQNAMHYNEESSSIWKDAKRLDDLVQEHYTSAVEAGVLPPLQPPGRAGARAPPPPPPPPAGHTPAPAPPSSSAATSQRGGSHTPLPSTSALPPTPGAAAAAAGPGTPLTLAQLPKKRGRPTKEEAALRAAAGYVKKPPRARKTAPAGSPARDVAAAAPPAAVAVPPVPVVAGSGGGSSGGGGGGGWDYRPPSPSAMSDPALSDQEGTFAAYHAVAAALEDRLPRASGWDVDGGWWELPPGQDPAAKAGEVLDRLKALLDARGRRVAEALEEVPVPTENKLLSFQEPMSLDLIESKVAAAEYATAAEFDQDVCRLFEKARRWHAEGSGGYGEVLLLQRYYQDLTSAHPGSTSSATHFASLPGGPGNARAPLFPGSQDTVATFRLSARDRTFLDVASSKGFAFASGDYVHLANADEPAKPVVAQVFKLFVPTKGAWAGRTCVSACWYFRPEGTVHPASRLFWEGEVFKTGYFADHLIEDVLEKVGAQFYSKAIRGRPKAPYWYPGWPLYVVESRYNAKDRQIVKIKNWASCIPEELRRTDFMPIAPFPQTVQLVKRISPFLTGATGPGCLGYPEVRKREGAAGEGAEEEESGSEAAADTPGRPAGAKKLRLGGSAGGVPLAGGALGLGAGKPVMPLAYGGGGGGGGAGSVTPSVLSSAGGGGAYGHSQRPSPASSRRPSATALPPPVGAGGAALPFARAPVLPAPPLAGATASAAAVAGRSGAQGKKAWDRSVVGNSGGVLWAGKTAEQAIVGAEVVSRFPTDPITSSLLWFSGPPAPPPADRAPRAAHSLAYLSYLASRDTPPALAEAEALDGAVQQAMRALVRRDPGADAAAAFGREFDGVEESAEWRAAVLGL